MTSKFVDGIIDLILSDTSPVTPEQQADVQAFDAAIEEGKRRLGRFFIDTLTTTGEHFLIPSSRRAEWNAFDAESEETAELLPVPTWAKRVAELSHVEFEGPEEIFK